MALETKKVTRNDVARRAGVAPSTVSYVINNGPRPVSEETRAKVLEAIDALEYRPNAVARHLRRQCTTTIGLIVPDTCNTYFAEVAQGIEAVAFENNYMVMFCHTDYQMERELAYVDTLYAEQVAGVIIIPATRSVESLKRLQKYHIPTVSLDRTAPGIGTPVVVAKNYHGGYLATQHLLGLGHRRIGCIARPVEMSHAEERVRGHLTALRDAGIEDDPSLIARGGYKLEDGQQAMSQLLDLAEPPTAVFCYNDMMAIGALRCAKERGLDVPGDISVVGFDDIAEAAFTCPALTTVHQDKFEMGRQGMDLLLSLITEKPDQEILNGEPLDVSLIVRESTGPAPF